MARQKKETEKVKPVETQDTAEVVNETAEVKEDTEAPQTVETQDTAEVVNETAEVKEEKKLPSDIDKILRLNRQYKKVYITKDGFAHPEGASKVLVEKATLYDNPYFK